MEHNRPETDPHIYENSLYNRVGIIDHEERTGFSINDTGTRGYLFVKSKEETGSLPSNRYTQKSIPDELKT